MYLWLTIDDYLMADVKKSWNCSVGYGAGGRLGISGTDSVLVPTLLESIQHVFIKKVAVNSGGKHCLALSADSDVYSWGEGDDGKLGHDNRRYGQYVIIICIHIVIIIIQNFDIQA